MKLQETGALFLLVLLWPLAMLGKLGRGIAHGVVEVIDPTRSSSSIIDLRDIFVFGGLGCIAYGAAQIYPPAGWIVAGAGLFWLGIRKS